MQNRDILEFLGKEKVKGTYTDTRRLIPLQGGPGLLRAKPAMRRSSLLVAVGISGCSKFLLLPIKILNVNCPETGTYLASSTLPRGRRTHIGKVSC